MTIQQGLSRSRPALPEAYVRALSDCQAGLLDNPINLFMVNLHHPYIRVPAGIL